MSNKYPSVTPGEIVPGGTTYLNNAQVVGDDLYLRDANGTIIPGRQVDNGDRITVLDVSYSKQLCLIQYSTPSGIRQGYVTNATSIIKYFNQGQWRNGSTKEIVYDENDKEIGSLDPNEIATPLYSAGGKIHVVYNTKIGENTKSGYVIYEGSKVEVISIPDITVPGVEKREYGRSGQGRPLIVHKIGNGSKALVMVCEVHGFEDNWNKDGLELVNIGHDLIRSLATNGTNGWSVYVVPSANPDGLAEGYTKDGPGRCTIVGRVDINRDFPIGFSAHGPSRYWTGDEPFSVNESQGLRDLLLGIKKQHTSEMIVIDLHGWEGAAIGNPAIGQYFRNQFGFEQREGYGADRGFLIAWANQVLGAKAALIELPNNTHSHNDVVNGAYSQKIINAVTNLLNSSNGSTGWVQRENKWYYYENGSMVIGWKQINGIWYHLELDGVMTTGWKKIGDDWYYLQVNGAMAIGWLTLGDNKYYLNGSGHMLIGEHVIDGTKYTFDISGALISNVTGWRQANGFWYYYENGSMVIGWKQINGIWYHLELNGVMTTGWKKVGDDWYYLQANGAMAIGWLTLGDNKYYLNGSGHMLIGEHVIDGSATRCNMKSIA